MFLHRISKNVWVEKWPWMVSNSQETQRVFKCHCFSWEFNQCVKSPNWVWAIRTEDLFMTSSLAFRKAFICLQKEVLCLQLRATWPAVWLCVQMDDRCLGANHSHPVLKAIVTTRPPQRRCFLDLVIGWRLGGKKMALSNLDWELIHWKISRVFQKCASAKGREKSLAGHQGGRTCWAGLSVHGKSDSTRDPALSPMCFLEDA